MTPEQIARYEAFPRPGTPGPWVVSTDHGEESAEIVCMAIDHPDRLKDIATKDSHGTWTEAWLDDFRAIAAAPEMREAIDVLLAEVARLRGELRHYRTHPGDLLSDVFEARIADRDA